jgi:hypothetical protein
MHDKNSRTLIIIFYLSIFITIVFCLLLNPKISIAIRNPLICVIIYLIERNRIFIWQNFSIEKSGLKLSGLKIRVMRATFS